MCARAMTHIAAVIAPNRIFFRLQNMYRSFIDSIRHTVNRISFCKIRSDCVENCYRRTGSGPTLLINDDPKTDHNHKNFCIFRHPIVLVPESVELHLCSIPRALVRQQTAHGRFGM